MDEKQLLLMKVKIHPLKPPLPPHLNRLALHETAEQAFAHQSVMSVYSPQAERNLSPEQNDTNIS